ncbi:hypothetical protein WDU94_004805 [Cyamophila willieti]
MSNENTDDFCVELVLPVIEESTLQNKYPDGQYLVVGDSNQEYVSPSILQHLPNLQQVSQNEIKSEYSSQNGFSNSDLDSKIIAIRDGCVESNDNETYRECLEVTSQTNQTNGFHEDLKSSANQKSMKCNNTESISPSTSSNSFISNYSISQSTHSPISSNSLNSGEVPNYSTTQTNDLGHANPSCKPSSGTSVKSSYSNNVNFNQPQSNCSNMNDQLVEDMYEFNFNDQSQLFETKFQSNFDPFLKASNFQDIKQDIKSLSLTNSNTKKFCPQCRLKLKENRELKYFQVALDSSILLCSTDKCTYPFDTPNETLKIKTFSVEDELLSKIDFDISNTPLNMKNINKQLSEQENDIVKPFLHNFEKFKINFQRFVNGDLKNPDDDVLEENETLMNFINEAMPSNQDNNVQAQYLDPKEEANSQYLDPKQEAKFNPKEEEIEDIDRYIEEQDRELQRMEMLQHFL